MKELEIFVDLFTRLGGDNLRDEGIAEGRRNGSGFMEEIG